MITEPYASNGDDDIAWSSHMKSCLMLLVRMDQFGHRPGLFKHNLGDLSKKIIAMRQLLKCDALSIYHTMLQETTAGAWEGTCLLNPMLYATRAIHHSYNRRCEIH